MFPGAARRRAPSRRRWRSRRRRGRTRRGRRARIQCGRPISSIAAPGKQTRAPAPRSVAAAPLAAAVGDTHAFQGRAHGCAAPACRDLARPRGFLAQLRADSFRVGFRRVAADGAGPVRQPMKPWTRSNPWAWRRRAASQLPSTTAGALSEAAVAVSRSSKGPASGPYRVVCAYSMARILGDGGRDCSSDGVERMRSRPSRREPAAADDRLVVASRPASRAAWHVAAAAAPAGAPGVTQLALAPQAQSDHAPGARLAADRAD